MQKSKTKTLLVYMILDKYSDEFNPLSANEIIEHLAEYGIECERKSIYADVAALNEIGCKVETTSAPKRGFYMVSRVFQLAEVRLLIDAVSSAGFVTPGKTKSLVAKLESLVSVPQAESLESQVYCDSSNKCSNEEIYYVIDSLHDAIKRGKAVTFKYRRRNIDKHERKNYTEKTFTVSPYALIWKDDHYYLVCNNKKYDNLMNLRMDRIKRVVILDTDQRPFSEVSNYKNVFDSADYASKMFNMFSGVDDDVTLSCDLELREEMMDRFGASIPLTATDVNHFKTTIHAFVSDGLVSWIMQYGNKVEVLSPDYLRDMITKKTQEIYSVYNTCD